MSNYVNKAVYVNLRSMDCLLKSWQLMVFNQEKLFFLVRTHCCHCWIVKGNIRNIFQKIPSRTLHNCTYPELPPPPRRPPPSHTQSPNSHSVRLEQVNLNPRLARAKHKLDVIECFSILCSHADHLSDSEGQA